MNKIVKLLNCLIVLLLALIVASPVMAAIEATSSASDSEVKAKIKERLEQVAETDFQQVKNEAQLAAGKVYAWVGTTAGISQPTLSIKTTEGDKQAKIASSAAILKVIQGKGRTTIKEEEITTGQYIIVMGPKDENGTIIAKRIVISDQPAASTVIREIIFGKVTEVDDEKIVVKKNGDSATLTITSKTKLKIVGQQTPTISKVQVNDYAAAIVIVDKNDKITAVKTVLVIPGATNPDADANKVNEEATASASPSSSAKPTASPKATASPKPSPKTEE